MGFRRGGVEVAAEAEESYSVVLSLGEVVQKTEPKKYTTERHTHPRHVQQRPGWPLSICVHHCLAGEAWALIFASSARSDARNTPTRAALSLAPFSALGSSRKMRAFVSFATS